MPACDSYLVPPHPSSPGAQDNFPSVPRVLGGKHGPGLVTVSGLAMVSGPEMGFVSVRPGLGLQGPHGREPLLTDGLCPCHQLHVTAKHRWLLQERWQGSVSQSVHTKSLCRTAGCQHGEGKVQSSLTGLPGEHLPWGQGRCHRCRARPQLEGKPNPARCPQPCHAAVCGRCWAAQEGTAR